MIGDVICCPPGYTFDYAVIIEIGNLIVVSPYYFGECSRFLFYFSIDTEFKLYSPAMRLKAEI